MTLYEFREGESNSSESFESLSKRLGQITSVVDSYLREIGFNQDAVETSWKRANYFYSRGEEEATLRTWLTRVPLEARAELETSQKQIHREIMEKLRKSKVV